MIFIDFPATLITKYLNHFFELATQWSLLNVIRHDLNLTCLLTSLHRFIPVKRGTKFAFVELLGAVDGCESVQRCLQSL